MKLKNNFPKHVRNLYLYEYQCWLCSRSDRGLEIHHIFGRVSSSPCNASVVCMDCHSHMGHSSKEHVTLLSKALKFLAREGYRYDMFDIAFLSSVRSEFEEATKLIL